jgi:prepilin-type N-terminal cleavage/methylation domain-containing protein
MRNKRQFSCARTRSQQGDGFTLIELLVVISIIALIGSVVLTALADARQKARDGKRIGDMGQIVKALELFFDTYKGYPAAEAGGDTQVPVGLNPEFVITLPVSPNPADGGCSGSVDPSPATSANSYYYEPQGDASVVNGVTVYRSYNYYFCLGKQTGSLAPGVHIMSPTGIQ